MTIELTNAPLSFRQSAYEFDLRENADDRRRPVELGRLEADDP